MNSVQAQQSQQYGQHSPVSDALSSFEQEKVVEFLRLVKWIVNRILNRLPRHINGDDLIHSGILGLIDAVKRFSWGRPREPEEFKAYAECRIRGQIMDELRRMDALPRSAREKVNKFKRTFETLCQQLKREPTEYEICAELKVDLETCHQMRAEMAFGKEIPYDSCQNPQSIEEMLLQTLDDVAIRTPESQLHIEQVKKLLGEEIANLEEKERQVVSLYYLEEMTLKEIGVILSITESRVSQIHAAALAKLLKRLRLSLDLD
ncbi:MAG: FliA/WhiG family RNA polymerase sigma factor [Deltaproteobacteria bacterium]|nr:FliA/WhiG family RNA polymerase sigma factor [Deltaproteobacteria bacterium]